MASRRGWLLGGLVLVSGFFGPGCSAFTDGATAANVEVVAEFENDRPSGGLEFEGDPWLLTRGDDTSTKLLQLDAETGDVVSERVVPWQFQRGVLIYGSNWVGHMENPEPDRHPDGMSISETRGLVVEFDPRTGAEVRTIATFSYGDFDRVLVDGDYYWRIGGLTGPLDLVSGTSWEGYDLRVRQTWGLRREGSQLWSIQDDAVIEIDLQTRDVTLYPLAFELGTYQFHDGRYWVRNWQGAGTDDWASYDYETGELGDERLAETEMPERSWVRGDYRWDEYSDGIWHQVELATGETVERFDFGDYEPWFSASGYLWLLDYRTGDDGFVGATVGRILEDPSER